MIQRETGTVGVISYNQRGKGYDSAEGRIGSDPFGNPARYVEDPMRRNPKQIQNESGHHSMRTGLADRIVAAGPDFYHARIKAPTGGHYHGLGKRQEARRDHANTLRGQIMAGGLTDERARLLNKALEIIGYSNL